jgi:ATP-binding cassette subfamily B multidrug efflux pump
MLGVAIVIVLLVGGREVILRHRITVGSFVAFNTYMMQLTWPIIALGWVINIFQRGTASMGRIRRTSCRSSLRSPTRAIGAPPLSPVVGDRVGPNHDPTEVRGDIEFRNLSFRYGNTLLAAERGNGRPTAMRRSLGTSA